MKIPFSWFWWRLIGKLISPPKHGLYCPSCHYDGCGDFYEVGFEVIASGKEPSTPLAHGSYWVEGVQTCPRCLYRFELHG